MIQIHKELNEDFFIGIDERDELFVCEHPEGEPLFAIPDSMSLSKGFAMVRPSLIDVAILISLERDTSRQRGIAEGKRQASQAVHDLLGITELVRSIDSVANEVTTLANTVSNLR